MADEFLTLSEELLPHAECAAKHFFEYGHKIKIEPEELEYPYVPALRCKRAPMTLIVEVAKSVLEDRMTAWALFARSCQRDTRIAVVVPSGGHSVKDDDKLRDLGVGLYVSDGDKLTEVVAPKDLALNVALPELKTHAPKMRKVLGPVYEQFEHSQWREGFEEACQAVEVLARKYLIQHMSTGRIQFVSPAGTVINHTASKVGKMPMGALADRFGEIQVSNYRDARIGKVLRRINKDRIGVAHYKGQALQEARLRKNVRQNMYLVFAALKELLSVK